jgi:hypothetical protein
MQTNCNHKEWFYPPPAYNDWTGEWDDQEPYERSIQEDISIGSFMCRRCGHIGYYTGQWKRYFEEGVDCPGSEGVNRNV